MRRGVAAWLVLVLGGLLAGCTSAAPDHVTRQPVRPASPDRPNIVFVLTDDLSTDLLRFMPHVRAMQRAGTSFSNYTVTDSLCCPSRASILTGRYPHDTHVFTNSGPGGGYEKFKALGEQSDTFAVRLQDAGYRTAFMGKYLNGYDAGVPGDDVPTGWDEWDGVGNGYHEFDYVIAHGQSSQSRGHEDADYLTTVLQGRATDFVRSAAASRTPYFLEVATFAPHSPYVPAPQDRDALPGLRAPRTRAFDRLPTHPPTWLGDRGRLSRSEVAAIDRDYRRRAQAVLSVDRMLGAIQQAVHDSGGDRDTVVVFSSDNGYHMGEYRLTPGKMTAFDTDVNVPLVVQGPHVLAGHVSRAIVQNVDLAPTFESLAGVRPSRRLDGSSFVRLLRHRRVPGWTEAALVEHRGPVIDLTDPDYPQLGSGNPPSYEALRTARYTYVEYGTGDVEFYDRTRDLLELHDLAARLSPRRVRVLHRRLARLRTCTGVRECTVARAHG